MSDCMDIDSMTLAERAEFGTRQWLAEFDDPQDRPDVAFVETEEIDLEENDDRYPVE